MLIALAGKENPMAICRAARDDNFQRALLGLCRRHAALTTAPWARNMGKAEDRLLDVVAGPAAVPASLRLRGAINHGPRYDQPLGRTRKNFTDRDVDGVDLRGDLLLRRRAIVDGLPTVVLLAFLRIANHVIRDAYPLKRVGVAAAIGMVGFGELVVCGLDRRGTCPRVNAEGRVVRRIARAGCRRRLAAGEEAGKPVGESGREAGERHVEQSCLVMTNVNNYTIDRSTELMGDTWAWYLRRTAGLLEVPVGAESPYDREKFIAQVLAQKVQDAALARIESDLDREIRRIDDEAIRQRTRALSAARCARDALVPLTRVDLPRRVPKRPRVRQPLGKGSIMNKFLREEIN